MPGMGDVHFPIATRNPLAQKFFDQGIGQLHGFFYFESERSFRQVAALDPFCATAYWGMAMANVNNAKRAKEFIKTAEKYQAGVSPRACRSAMKPRSALIALPLSPCSTSGRVAARRSV